MSMTRNCLVACCRILPFLMVATTCGAEFQATKTTASKLIRVEQPKLTPLLICPPRYSTPIVVSADELLREADQVAPVTPEGWIVRNRPVGDCANCVGDIEAMRYKMFEYPLKLRQYNSKIRLLNAELASWQRKMTTYKYFNKAQGIPVTVENTRLTILATQEQLRNLRYERMLFIRQHQLEQQLSQGVVTSAP